MSQFRPSFVAGALTGVLLAFSVPGLAAAGPMSFPGAGTVTPHTSTIVDVRYYHRYPAAPAIAFGLFGAVLGSAIADSQYDNYDYYGYSRPYYSSGGPAMSADGTAPDTVADITAEAIAGSSKVTTTDPTTARQRGGDD